LRHLHQSELVEEDPFSAAPMAAEHVVVVVLAGLEEVRSSDYQIDWREYQWLGAEELEARTR